MYLPFYLVLLVEDCNHPNQNKALDVPHTILYMYVHVIVCTCIHSDILKIHPSLINKIS